MILSILWAATHVYNQKSWSQNYSYVNGPQGVKEDTNTHQISYTKVDDKVKVGEMKRKRTRQEFEGIRTGYDKLEQKAAKGTVTPTGYIENAQTRERTTVAKKTKIDQQPENGQIHIDQRYNVPLYFPIPTPANTQDQSLAFIPHTAPRIEEPKIGNCHGGKCEWTVGDMTGTNDKQEQLNK